MQTIEYKHGDYLFTSDKQQVDIVATHQWLSDVSYWKKNIPYDTVSESIKNSFCISILHNGGQIGFCRLITDYATFAYLADVYILERHRGKGLSKNMMELIVQLEWVTQLQRIMLATLDAHDLYQQFGFTPLRFPERFMEISRPAIYNDPENPFL